jgi:hypothetical protein
MKWQTKFSFLLTALFVATGASQAALTQLSLLGGIFNYFWRSGCQIANDLMGFEV